MKHPVRLSRGLNVGFADRNRFAASAWKISVSHLPGILLMEAYKLRGQAESFSGPIVLLELFPVCGLKGDGYISSPPSCRQWCGIPDIKNIFNRLTHYSDISEQLLLLNCRDSLFIISMAKYTIRGGDTFFSIAQHLGISVSALEAANPGINPKALQVGQVIHLPGGEAPKHPPSGTGIPGSHGGSNGGGDYVQYGGPASNFPHSSQWASYQALWAQNSRLMKFHDSDSEIAQIKSAIETVATESGVDVRVILCIIVQESGGNVRVKSTWNGVHNPGLMQSHNGVSFNPADPAGSILQMVRDGTEGTRDGAGLKQLHAKYGNYYSAFRAYNSGSVDEKDLNNPVGATASYVRDAANRLMGHSWNGM
jgi:murein DD-endopeptidase MepM/ murein hydrolase activator NlpD